MKRFACILLAFCSAAVACNRYDPFSPKRGRFVGPRLSGAAWSECCEPAPKKLTCGDLDTRNEALAALVVAHGDCLDVAFRAVQQHAKEDLSAAYFIRAQRRRDPVDLLHALHTARDPFNRALAQQKLGLTAEAIQSWDQVARTDRSPWGKEAEKRRNALMNDLRNAPRWKVTELQEALNSQNRGKVETLVRALPADAARFFEKSNLLDPEASRMLAGILRDSGDSYAWDVVAAMERTKEREALERGVAALRNKENEQAAALLERAGNPLASVARYKIAAGRYLSEDVRPILDAIPTEPGYRELSTRVHLLRAAALEQADSYAEALKAYVHAIESAQGDPTLMAGILARRSLNYATIGNTGQAFRDALAAMQLVPRIADVNARFHAFESASKAARDFGYPAIAFLYATGAISVTRAGVDNAAADDLGLNKLYLITTLRARAEAYVALGREAEAANDLREAAGLAEAIGSPVQLSLLRMRIHEVQGLLFLKSRPAEAVGELTHAIELASEQNLTYRANLHFKRATARRKAALPGADEDMTEAFAILGREAKALLGTTRRGEYEELWRPYFSRFRPMQHQLIKTLIDQGDPKGAFVYTEQARAFEPMHALLHSQAVRGFKKIESTAELDRQLASLPDDTVILQYVVLDDRSYMWVLARNSIRLVSLRPGRTQIEGWVNDAITRVQASQAEGFEKTLYAAHEELFKPALDLVGVADRKRLVIVPDGPMHGLPFAALRGSADSPFLVQRFNIAVAGSTSLYLYALRRDAQFPAGVAPSVLVVGNPAVDPAIRKPLPFAHEEAIQLGRDYRGAKVLLGAEATTRAVLAAVPKATIFHFAGHGIASPHSPWNSMLLLARDGNDSGELTARRIMSELSRLDRTQLVVLAACGSASGQAVGPEGVAPLVRPFIAANVPAVLGTLWEVRDATTKNLTVSLHCHYRNGDDVAVALQKAQLEMLRKNVDAMHWAPFQVTGYAESPYARRIAMEKTHNDELCTENSLHRPDGLHPQ